MNVTMNALRPGDTALYVDTSESSVSGGAQYVRSVRAVNDADVMYGLVLETPGVPFVLNGNVVVPSIE